MFSAFQTFGKLGALASSVARAWSPLALWPDGIATPGMWISPRDLTSQWAEYTGTTPVSVPGTVADSANPVGLALDIRAGATVLTDPGLHMLKSTSAARPLLSARVNLLTYSEDFSNAAWVKDGATVSANAITAPDGTLTADAIVENAVTGSHRVYVSITTTANPTFYVCAKKGTRNFLMLQDIGGAKKAWFDLNTGVVGTATAGVTSQISPLGGGWYLCAASINATSSIYLVEAADADNIATYAGVNGNTAIYVWGAQLNLGPTALDYQRVGAASDYDASAGPTYLKFDGVDDGMATASFSAGTLTSGMDCMIAVRRDGNSTQSIGGLYQTDGSKYFGVIGKASDVLAGTYGGCGTPSIFVDNVAVSNTRGALYDTIGLGEWHILEYRGLDLSAWTSVAFGSYGGGYMFPGPRGDIMLYPSTDSTEDKDAARQWLADYYGVTLP